MRARNLKPSLFKHELLATADPLYAWIFQGLWCLADREGRLEDRPQRIHLEINPGRAYEGTAKALDWLAEHGFITRYKSGQVAVIQVVNFGKHQNPHHKEPASKLPEPEACPGQVQGFAPNTLGQEPEASPGQAQGKPESGPIPTVLIPDSPSLIPDSPSLNPENSVGQEPDGPGVPRETVDAKPDQDDPVREIFDHWRKTHGHDRAVLNASRRRLIRTALADFSPADLCRAISGYLNSPHHMGQNERATRYDAIEVFLRDAKHIEAGLRFADQPPRTDLSAKTRQNVAAIADWTPPEVRRAAN